MPPDAVNVLLQFRLTLQLFMEVVVIVSAVVTVIESGCVSVCDSASVTRTVKLEMPVLVGVPEISPFELKVRFAGSDPALRLQTNVPVPPLACRVWL